MDPRRFDSLVRSLVAATTRRRALGALALGMLGLGAAADEVGAGLTCAAVGARCRDASECCSGVCQGAQRKKRKKGKKGKKRKQPPKFCQAHDTADCALTGGACGMTQPCTTTANQQGSCVTTIGNAPYCAADGDCYPCSNDKECEDFCEAGAACIQCTSGCTDTDGRRCAGIGACQFPPPP